MKIKPTTKKLNRPVLICAQPTIKYYAWQVEVMLTNFRSLDIHNHFDVHVLFAYNESLDTVEDDLSWGKSVENSFPEFSFYYYNDTRRNISYISSIRPHILKKHFKQHPHLSRVSIFYHDCDIIFTKFPDFIANMSDDDENWYVSDTISYIGYEYVVSKGVDVLEAMCAIIGIHPELVKERESQSGGAQYLMKGVDWMFFEKVERDCERLFRDISLLNTHKKQTDPYHHEIQIWCADMWAVLWNAWMRGYRTNIATEMDFCWATDSIDRCGQTYIFHNAGVTSDNRSSLFYKYDFKDRLPYGTEDTYDDSKASHFYFLAINSVKDSLLPKNEKNG